MGLNATFSINGNPPGIKASVPAGGPVVATLDSIAGVKVTSWRISTTDETTAPGDYALAVSGSVGEQCDTVALIAGTAAILEATVTDGVQTDVKTAKFFVPAPSGFEVGCAGEQLESDPVFGTTGLVNNIIRTGGGGPPVGPAGPTCLSGAYPDPLVIGAQETSGPDVLTFANIVDGAALVRTGLTIAGIPTPANQLGGTWANPTVVGITETSGPSALGIGAIADGDMLLRSGPTVIGQAPSNHLSNSWSSTDVVGLLDLSGTSLTYGVINDGDELVRSGVTVVGVARNIYGTERVYAEALPFSTTTSNVFVLKLSLTHAAVDPGSYQLRWSYSWNHNSTGNDFNAQIQNGSGTVLMDHFEEPKDAGGAGPGGTDQIMREAGFIELNYGAVTTDTFSLSFRSSVAGVLSGMGDARLEFVRVA